ncbi:hypothetical protein H7A76_12025 [Pseudomonas sp. MSSRFD41]|uniref:hypothetical protein n=1 Tax=Pseudomonas sp. MSSRFD41 TaxID=1310370 RepID=UPI00163ADBFD|nr:hypothetical protein [Pseudomonas sp. MSSRFD41]
MSPALLLLAALGDGAALPTPIPSHKRLPHRRDQCHRIHGLAIGLRVLRHHAQCFFPFLHDSRLFDVQPSGGAGEVWIFSDGLEAP